MHIPDGYLSPATCVTLYAGAAPFWYVALKRVEKSLSSRMVPLLSVCAAFSFVIMMFNVPLPCGTTGHAVGMCVTTVVLGPWASMLAISVALLIQCIFYGDGGITAFGANCFNMAVVGSLVSHLLYTAISGCSVATSKRRVVAAAIAGYVAINVAALCAGIEFGIQPIFFHDAVGAPLYAPYPLRIAVPAMMIGHLTFAGLAECAVSAGVVAWLQHSNVELLRATLPSGNAPGEGGWIFTRPFWIGVTALMIATPLGLLAGGTAWGEWALDDFKNPAARSEIAAASHNVAPPAIVPKGLERLSEIWTAPFPDYAPAFIKSKSLGYILSAMAGTGTLLAIGLILDWIVRFTRCAKPSPSC